jgi:uncharacterized OsmC-like protein
MLITSHHDSSILFYSAKLFVLMAGEHHHRHAEHSGPGPESMLLHAITSCTAVVTRRLFIFMIAQFTQNVK